MKRGVEGDAQKPKTMGGERLHRPMHSKSLCGREQQTRVRLNGLAAQSGEKAGSLRRMAAWKVTRMAEPIAHGESEVLLVRVQPLHARQAARRYPSERVSVRIQLIA